MPHPFVLPGTRPRYAPDRLVDVEHIRLDLDVDLDQRKIAGTCTTTVVAIRDGVRWVTLDACELDVASVTLSGQRLPHAHDGKQLRIDFGTAVAKAGARATFVVAYAAAPRRGLWFVGPDADYPDRPRQVWSQGQDEDSRFWFPCFDSPHEKATSEVVATVPDGLRVLSNGTLRSVQPAGAGKQTWHWQLDVPHSCYLITLAVGELAVITDHVDGIELTYLVPPGREADAKRALGITPEVMRLFTKTFGHAYPFPRYAQVCVAEFIFGGMENSSATTLTDTCLYDERAALDYDVDSLVAHELAHQWFGDLVTCRDWGQGWLNEGFATYSEYVWRAHKDGLDEAWMELAEWREQYFDEDAHRYRRAIATSVYEAPIDLFDRHLYEKGGLVLHMLRGQLGDAAFWDAIKLYLERHKHGAVETRDLARAVEAATGKNLDWFFDQWVMRAGHPELEADVSWDAETGRARVEVRQVQKVEGETPLFRLPLTARFRVGDGDVEVPLEVREAREVFFVPLAKAPTQAILDPGRRTLASWKIEKGKPLWIEELAKATDAPDRIVAALALGRAGGADAIAALVKALGSDTFWGVRAAAADALATIRGADATRALADALKSTTHPKARRAVARALGQLRHDTVAGAALAALVKAGDPSLYVEAEACLALGRTRVPEAGALLREAATRPSYLETVKQHAYRGLAAARDEAAYPLLLQGTRAGELSHARRSAVYALAELSQARLDLPARDARERIEALLLDPDFRLQQAAIEGLNSIGDPRAIPALERTAALELDGRLRRRSREVIRDLGERRAHGELVTALRDDLEKLGREVVALRDRVGKLEPGPKSTPVAKSAPKTAPKKPTPAAKKVAPKKKGR